MGKTEILCTMWKRGIAMCRVCGGEERPSMIRNINIYVTGSEGLNVCHSCEMHIVEYIRGLQMVAARAKLAGVKIGRRE